MSPEAASNPGPRAVILGLDGMGAGLVERLCAMGRMPALAALSGRAACGAMGSSLPEISPVAWTSFYTAAQPGVHGIYGFTEFAPGRRGVRYNTSAEVAAPTLWELLSRQGKRCAVLNAPQTYPARPLKGVMVSGFVAVDLAKAAYPAWVGRYLAASGYRLEADFERVRQDRAGFLDELTRVAQGRLDLLDKFAGQDSDLVFLCATDTDRLHHFFYSEVLDESGPRAGQIDAFYRLTDDTVAAAFALAERMAASGPVLFLVVSDHGFAEVVEEFHLNRWLMAQGLGGTSPDAAPAAALDPTRIYFNTPNPPLDRLKAALLEEPAVRQVFDGADLYQGPRAGLAPDLVVLPAPGYEFKARFDQGRVYTPSPLTGAHTLEDAFYLALGLGFAAADPRPADIEELGRYVFRHFGLAPPLEAP